jgi:hypothetical protein
MNDRKKIELPVHGRTANESREEDAPSCSPKIYVSNEEAAVVKSLLGLKARVDLIRRKIASCADQDERQLLEADLEELREQWSELSGRREAAYRRKMVMLGHLPPEVLFE